jgi:GT2 family glycosyltransferase
MNISIIIPSYIEENRLSHLEDYLHKCLQSINKYTINSIEIIIVANGCCKKVINYLFDFCNTDDRKLVVCNKPMGFARSVNLGIKIAKGDKIIILNDDTELLPQYTNQWIDLLLQPFNKPNVVISGIMYNTFLSKKFVVGFCMMIDRKFLDTYGLLDESLHPGWGEDIDLCLRAQKYGFDFSIVDDNLEMKDTFVSGSFPIYHKGEATFHDYPEFVKEGIKLHEIMAFRIKNGFYNKITL